MSANPTPKAARKRVKMRGGPPFQVNLYEAKTRLSSLVERASKGEEIVIAKAGKPMAKLVMPASKPAKSRKPGGNFMKITYIADDFDAPLPDDVLRDFGL